MEIRAYLENRRRWLTQTQLEMEKAPFDQRGQLLCDIAAHQRAIARMEDRLESPKTTLAANDA